jgi:hypothetical protein
VVDLEMAVSNNDNNLFSSIDDANNSISTKISAKQRIFSKRWKLDAFTNYQFTQKLSASRKDF